MKTSLLIKRLISFIFVFSFAGVINTYGQYCVGYTKYSIKKPDGSVLKTKDLKHLDFVEFDGKRRDILLRYGKLKVNYPIERQNRNHTITYEDDVSIYFGYCGQIGGLKLTYKGITMKLIFDIGIDNTNYSIEALPFQEGIFKLTSLKCQNGKNPPPIDNEHYGSCTVPSKYWEKQTPDDTKTKAPADI